MGRLHALTIEPVPEWVDVARLVGVVEALHEEPLGAGLRRVRVQVPRDVAADVQARLRGLGLDGEALQVRVEPALTRSVVRAARTVDARRRRAGTVGFRDGRVQVDGEGRMSLTPEALALAMARSTRGQRVLDACCGVGGNAIAFARSGAQVTALESDQGRLALARHNARLYGVVDRMRFVFGDARVLVPQSTADLLFVDPPWGAEYSRLRVGLEDLPLLRDLLPVARRFGQVWLKVPPSFDCRQLPWATPTAVFGEAAGDFHRIKFLWLRFQGVDLPADWGDSTPEDTTPR